MNVAVWVMSGRFLVSEAPHVAQRQRVVPAVVVPFLFIVPVQMGHRGRFVGMVLANSVVLAQLCVGGDLWVFGLEYACWAYYFGVCAARGVDLRGLAHTFCRLTHYLRVSS